MAEDVAALDVHGDLGGQQPVLGVRIEVVARRLSRLPAVEAVGPEVPAVGAHLQNALFRHEPVVAAEGNATAELARAGPIAKELVGQDLDRVLGFRHLDRLRGHVDEQVCIAVQAVGPRPPAPGPGGEVDVDERRAVRIVAADGDACVAAVGRRTDPVRQHHGDGAKAAVQHAEAGEPARRAGRRKDAVGDGSRRCDHLDGAEYAFVAGDVVGQHAADGGIDRRLGIRERRVDGALDLRRRAGPVGDDAVCLLGQRDEQPDRLAEVDAVVVDPVLEAVDTVGQLADGGAGHAFGVVDHLLHVEMNRLHPVTLDEFQELLLGDMAGGELGAKVAEDLDRQPHVLLDQGEERLIGLAARIEFERRDAQAFRIDLGRIGSVGTGDPPAHVRVVTD